MFKYNHTNAHSHSLSLTHTYSHRVASAASELLPFVVSNLKLQQQQLVCVPLEVKSNAHGQCLYTRTHARTLKHTFTPPTHHTLLHTPYSSHTQSKIHLLSPRTHTHTHSHAHSYNPHSLTHTRSCALMHTQHTLPHTALQLRETDASQHLLLQVTGQVQLIIVPLF